jgi:hypothetical protein
MYLPIIKPYTMKSTTRCLKLVHMPSVFVMMMIDLFHESFIRSTEGNVAYILNHTITMGVSSVEIIFDW